MPSKPAPGKPGKSKDRVGKSKDPGMPGKSKDPVFKVVPEGVFPLPSLAVPRDARFDEYELSDSDYDEAEDIRTATLEAKSPADEMKSILLKHRLDIDGRPISADVLYPSIEKAAAFTPMLVAGRPCEIPCVVLFDYFGGHSCMDLNVTAGERVAVVAEEFQVRRFSPCEFLRLPQQWSLARWDRPRALLSPLGLVPSSHLIAERFYKQNKSLFVDPWWCLGNCELNEAIDYLTADPAAQQPGLFVIFSPAWLNLDPTEHRPFLLLMLCDRSRKSRKRSRKPPMDTVSDKGMILKMTLIRNDVLVLSSEPYFVRETDERTKQATLAREIAKEAAAEKERIEKEKKKARNASREGKGGRKGRKLDKASEEAWKKPKNKGAMSMMSRANIGTVRGGRLKVAETDEEMKANGMARAAGAPYVTQIFTICRSYLGDYELAGRRFATLFDLVYFLANNTTELPHRLVYGQFSQSPSFIMTGVPSPTHLYPQKDLDALPMMSEQWSAKHHNQVVEPRSFSSPYTFFSRVIVNPLRSMHAKLCKAAGLDPVALENQKALIRRLDPPKDTTVKSVIPAGEIPDDEFAMHADNRLYIKNEDLVFDHSKPLGKGEFGAVYAGKLRAGNRMVEVAIKSQKTLRAERDFKLAWLGEMETLSMTSHPNVIRFFGFRVDPLDNAALLVFEIMNVGSMDKFCKKQNYALSAWEVVDFLIQIARGMAHLHSRQPSLVHGDLAARNVLVAQHPFDTTRYILKITDLGLGKTVRPDLFTNYDDPNKIPFKWLPPEVLKARELTSSSDVWSLGMVAHEMYGIGEPYGMYGAEKIVDLLADGHRFEKQPKMPYYIYDVVLKCQRRLPYDRPSMSEVERLLEPYLIEVDSEHRAVVAARYALAVAQAEEAQFKEETKDEPAPDEETAITQ